MFACRFLRHWLKKVLQNVLKITRFWEEVWKNVIEKEMCIHACVREKFKMEMMK